MAVARVNEWVWQGLTSGCGNGVMGGAARGNEGVRQGLTSGCGKG